MYVRVIYYDPDGTARQRALYEAKKVHEYPAGPGQGIEGARRLSITDHSGLDTELMVDESMGVYIENDQGKTVDVVQVPGRRIDVAEGVAA